ncbi:MAG: hypothetical protein PHX43_04725 [Alphaproteobacteria bacterium]|nr:hypothetical protein [Alphaproteobacteria bacterium]
MTSPNEEKEIVDEFVAAQFKELHRKVDRLAAKIEQLGAGSSRRGSFVRNAVSGCDKNAPRQ